MARARKAFHTSQLDPEKLESILDDAAAVGDADGLAKLARKGAITGPGSEHARDAAKFRGHAIEYRLSGNIVRAQDSERASEIEISRYRHALSLHEMRSRGEKIDRYTNPTDPKKIAHLLNPWGTK